MPIRREAFDVVLFVFSDTRELIAAGKVQRWDVLKWTVTVNIGLAAAAASLRQSYPNSGWAFFICAVATGALGLGLILYYNRRMTRARERLRAIHKIHSRKRCELEGNSWTRIWDGKKYLTTKKSLYCSATL